jgi:hypothetical protein
MSAMELYTVRGNINEGEQLTVPEALRASNEEGIFVGGKWSIESRVQRSIEDGYLYVMSRICLRDKKYLSSIYILNFFAPR